MTGALALILLLAAVVVGAFAVRLLLQGGEPGGSKPRRRNRRRRRFRKRGRQATGHLFSDLVESEGQAANLVQRWEERLSDSHEAAELVNDYKRRAAAGDARAIHELATLYKIGQHVKRDTHKAAQLYAKGADLGDSVCMRELAAMYESGQGVKRDKITAYLLYDMALAHAPRGPDTHSLAEIIERNMKALRSEMTTMERAIADKHIKEQRESEQ